jgi:3-phenylpropionate/cinnamic acid dioxygenase small subunit
MRTDTYLRCVEFLNREAELLDDNRFADWLEQVADSAIDYRIPIRVTRERTAGSGFSDAGYHMAASYETFAVRVARFESEFAWGDDPPSRTRRFVSNVIVDPGAGGELEVRSNLLVYRSRFDSPEYLLICGRRHDTLTDSDGALRLRKRLVLLDHTTLATGSLGIIL